MGDHVTRTRRDRVTVKRRDLPGLRTVICPTPDLRAATAQGATLHTAPTEVGEGIVTANLQKPQGSGVGFGVNPLFAAT